MGNFLQIVPDKNVNWQLPDFEEVIISPKAYDYALVIPVINEGKRIREQLERIKKAELSVDIIVADGGSTDGSLELDFINSIGVRSILTKTGHGKLSAQLRMAYAWCLKQGYKGIITIDGNGKDNIEAISEFIKKLREGYDYVQGSRYISGGIAENTPLERTIGNRLIHAPLLSLSSGYWFTDTTNGYRAYSSNYLLDDRVAPFRSIFQKYNLLFYLTIRAIELNYNVCEIPVERRYPAKEPTPTKINSIAGKISLLNEAISAATKQYNITNHTSNKVTPKIYDLLLAILILTPLYLIINGYIFPGGNHGQELPPIIELCKPGIFAVDFAVNDFLKPGPRYFYNHLICGFHELGIRYHYTYLFLQIISVASIFAALLTIARLFSIHYEFNFQPLGIMFAIIAVANPTGWDHTIIHGSAVPSNFAMGIVVWGLIAIINKQFLFAYFLFGVAALLQFLVGLIPGLLLLPVTFIYLYNQKKLSVFIIAMAIFGTGLAAIYVPMALSTSGDVSLASNGMTPMEFFGKVRVPHHWLPSEAGIKHWINISSFYISGIVLIILLTIMKRNEGENKRHYAPKWLPSLFLVLFLAPLCLLLNYIFVEVYFVELIGKLQFQRVMPFARLAVFVAAFIVTYNLWFMGRKVAGISIIFSLILKLSGISLLLLTIYLIITSKMKKKSQISYDIYSAFIPISIFLFRIDKSDYYFTEHQYILGFSLIVIGLTLLNVMAPKYLNKSGLVKIGIINSLLAIIIIGNYGPKVLYERYNNRWNINKSPFSPESKLALLVKENSKKGEMILIPPYSTFGLFGLYAQRPVYFSWKNVPYRDLAIVEWSHRLEKLIGREPYERIKQKDIKNYYASLPSNEIYKVAVKAKASIIVSKLKWHSFSNAKLVAKQGEWGIWRITR